MKRAGTLILKNGVANLIRGGATAAAVILMPRFLTHLLDPQRFDAWVLMLQIASYASFLDFGLQTAVARFFAQADELGKRERKKQIITTALSMLIVAALFALVVISAVLVYLPQFFSGVPRSLLSEFRIAAFLLSVSSCLLLPLSTFTGVLTGLHRNEIPALAIGGTRILGALLTIAAATVTNRLPYLALCFGIPNLAGGLIQLFAVGRSGTSVFPLIYDRKLAVELTRFCAGLFASSVSMLFISGLDLTIVGHFDFAAVGYFAIASTLMTFFSGLTYAGLNALIAPLSALHARNSMEQSKRLLFTANRVVILVNCLLTSAIFLFGNTVLKLWVGEAYASAAFSPLRVLAIAQTVRLMVGVFGVFLVSVGEQKKAVGAAAFEAVLNLAASVVGAMWIGPMGVAYGTLLGAVGGFLWTLFLVIPSISACRITAAEAVRKSILPGVLPAVPIMMLAVLQSAMTPHLFSSVFALCLLLTLWLAFQQGDGGAFLRRRRLEEV